MICEFAPISMGFFFSQNKKSVFSDGFFIGSIFLIESLDQRH